jgi:hypothetical protein
MQAKADIDFFATQYPSIVKTQRACRNTASEFGNTDPYCGHITENFAFESNQSAHGIEQALDRFILKAERVHAKDPSSVAVVDIDLAGKTRAEYWRLLVCGADKVLYQRRNADGTRTVRASVMLTRHKKAAGAEPELPQSDKASTAVHDMAKWLADKARRFQFYHMHSMFFSEGESQETPISADFMVRASEVPVPKKRPPPENERQSKRTRGAKTTGDKETTVIAAE